MPVAPGVIPVVPESTLAAGAEVSAARATRASANKDGQEASKKPKAAEASAAPAPALIPADPDAKTDDNTADEDSVGVRDGLGPLAHVYVVFVSPATSREDLVHACFCCVFLQAAAGATLTGQHGSGPAIGQHARHTCV
jgi:hypothetical protein